ncbi:MAG: lysophospholipid acyltransferase family protein [Myxococcota bacterium]
MQVPTPYGKTVFSYLYTGGISMVAIVEVARGRPDRVPKIASHWARTMARRLGMRVRPEGLGRVPRDRPLVFVANHMSHLDVVALLAVVPVPVGFLAKRELQRVPVFGKAIEAGGNVFVDRGQRDAAVAAIEKAAEQVRDGACVVVFPEGTRGDGEKIRRFKKGAFHLAKAAGASIVPVGIAGSAALLRRHTRRIYPGSVRIAFGEPIAPEGTVDELLQASRHSVARLSGLPLSLDDTGKPDAVHPQTEPSAVKSDGLDLKKDS